jgi:hypothetical protein
MSPPICDDGRCGVCALCLTLPREEALPPGTLGRVRLGVDLEAPELIGSLRGAAVAVGVAALVSGTFLVAHGHSHSGLEVGVALLLLLASMLTVRRTRAWRYLLALAPLPLLASITEATMALGSIGCVVTEIAVMLPSVVAGALLLRRPDANLAGWTLSTGVAAVLATAAVHLGCPTYSGLLHVVALHVLPTVVFVLMLPRIARTLAPWAEGRRSTTAAARP